MEKERIGIMTLQASHNCGSMLQAYALKRVLEERYICKAEIINFCSPQQERMYAIWNQGHFVGNLLKNIKMLPYYRRLKCQYNDYEYFAKEYLNVDDRRFSSEKELKNANLDYDLIIFGSDQIWNMDMVDYDTAFWGEWDLNIPKAAYAASMGEVTESTIVKNRDFLLKNISAFTKISVRDDKTQKYLDEISGVTFPIVADPTLLLEEKQWSQIAGEERLVKEKYIFYYSYAYNSSVNNEAVKRISNELQLPVYVINLQKWKKEKYSDYGFKMSRHSGPLIYLNLMKYAEYVLVESLHGMIFSSIFEKKFLVFDLNLMKDEPIDARINSLAKQLGVQSRVLNPQEITIDNLLETIDYAKVDSQINTMRCESLKTLDDIVNRGE